jgi:DNA polymerase III alpha subunit (gram-positive type)
MTLVALLDVETTGTDNDAVAIEVAAALYDTTHAAVTESYATLIRHDSNAAEAVNRIPSGLLASARPREEAWGRVLKVTAEAAAFCAWNDTFDRRFVPSQIAGKPWLDAMDLDWPRPCASRGLVAVALAHDLGVAHAHRAAADVELMARLLTRARELGADLDAMVAKGLRPRALFVSLAPFEEKDIVKKHAFRWNDPIPGKWARRMAIDDAASLPFKVQQVAA